jgi:hypothetical protein
MIHRRKQMKQMKQMNRKMKHPIWITKQAFQRLGDYCAETKQTKISVVSAIILRWLDERESETKMGAYGPLPAEQAPAEQAPAEEIAKRKMGGVWLV